MSGRESVDLWSTPRSGGTATQVARLKMKSAFMERIAVLQDRIVWPVRNGGLHSIPITGGTPRALPGTEGLHLQSWPWASDIGHHGFHDKVNQTVLMNLETGERISLQAPPEATEMRCSPSWCVARVDRRYVTWRRGGGEPQPVDGSFFPHMGIRADRFADGSTTLYDLATGQKAGIGWTTPQGSTGFRDFGGLVISWEAPRCGAPGAIPCRSGEEPELAVLNLAAVP
ncbi:hypothetical protein [Nonomuraea sp. SYSU D8015]|uniref:hypothetical protein n=1 Tax=Nonomuraea sp. SYSU D8015 TaxID=2593644 RepID=UPI001660D61D|nr:hypothetical protein [Nonomuraea sp. SYSU D8015]